MFPLRYPSRSTTPPHTGEDRANQFILLLLGLQRASYAVPSVATLASPAYRSTALNTTLLAVTLAWNGWLFWHAARRGWFPRWLAWVDAALAAALLILVSSNLPPAYLDAAPNWSGRMAQAAAGLAGAAMGRFAPTAAAVGLLLGVHAAVTVSYHTGPGSLTMELVSCLNGLLWFAVVIGFAVRFLRRRGRLLDEMNAQRLAAESQLAADRARHATRMAHHRALHDTVLTTLTAIARGGIDHRAEQVQRRCARDADYVRRLLDDEAPPGDTMTDKLADVVGAAGVLGLRVNLHQDAPTFEVPPEVVAVLGDATREALNNVFKHAGVDEAWTTTRWEEDTLTIMVVDRGRGFDADCVDRGFGLRHSIVEPVRAVGGDARVNAVSGAGTAVELTWPA